MKLTAEQREQQVLSWLSIGAKPINIAKQLRISLSEVLRLKRKLVATTHIEERYSPELIRRVVRLAQKGVITKEIAYRLRIPDYQVRRIRTDYRLGPAPGCGARYPVSKETERALGRERRRWEKSMAVKFNLPLRSIQKLLRRKQ
jgi:DNA-binding CsgD family transcriptional regulator